VECVAVLRPAPGGAEGMERAGGLEASATT